VGGSPQSEGGNVSPEDIANYAELRERDHTAVRDALLGALARAQLSSPAERRELALTAVTLALGMLGWPQEIVDQFAREGMAAAADRARNNMAAAEAEIRASGGEADGRLFAALRHVRAAAQAARGKLPSQPPLNPDQPDQPPPA
jgi:hypothetical protein